jgi:hypothetical protein
VESDIPSSDPQRAAETTASMAGETCAYPGERRLTDAIEPQNGGWFLLSSSGHLAVVDAHGIFRRRRAGSAVRGGGALSRRLRQPQAPMTRAGKLGWLSRSGRLGASEVPVQSVP